MKAAILVKQNCSLSIEEIEFPNLKKGQVLVELAYSGVCHSQLMEVKGFRGDDPYIPHLLGHEGSGIVREVGEGITKVKVGDKVILGWIKGKGLDAGGSIYDSPKIGKVNAGGVTTFNSHAIISENRIYKLPTGIPMDIAVLFGCAVPTGAGIIFNTIKPKKENTIAIFGIGGIGLVSLMSSVIVGCEKIVAVDIEDNKLKIAKELGATHIINANKEEPVKAIKSLTNGGVEYAIDTAGLTKTIEQAFESIKRGGVCVFASHPKHGAKISIDPYELICGKKIIGSWGGDSIPDRDIPVYADFYLQGKFPLEKLLTKRYTLEQINEALDDLENRRINRPLIELNKDLGKL
ncbi:MAG: zinc-binding dehydrogenase [Flavobacteriales bacterium]|nr:zinc-binding dehydrogenase [Leptospiraceae bacterium]MCB9336321.1 zinc-binding dehydrogenase [Flavobacteriales bacterium]